MSDINDANEQAQPEQTVMFQIVIDKNGNIGVNGIALSDKSLCYGLIETAKDIIREMHQPKIIKPSGFMNHLRNGKR